MPALTTSVATRLADMAVDALHGEVDLTPKPGLVDRRSCGAHTDMNLAMLHTSAESLRPSFIECATAAAELSIGPGLRAVLGEIGRAGEAVMLEATHGVNTHRGALWALGLLCAGAALGGDAVTGAARLARIPDRARQEGAIPSHGQIARLRYGLGGAIAQAQRGFPDVRRYALPTLVACRAAGGHEDTARLNALVALIAHVDDTCVLHRDGPAGLSALQSAARAVVAAGGYGTRQGRRLFTALDDLCLTRRISPGGSADLLAATLFLDVLQLGRFPSCKR